MSTHAFLDYCEHRALARRTIMPGEHAVSWEPAEITTLLGSCVAACIWDSHRRIGGMNHFMLPDIPMSLQSSPSESSRPLRYGLYAMERLINDLLVMGAKRENLVAKVFGGGNISGALGEHNIGRRNSEFVLEFLNKDQIKVAAVDMGGIHSRRVKFYTDSGKVRVFGVAVADRIASQQERRYSESIRKDPVSGDIVFF
ncbi:MAG: chemoreceptor glutamine deamidase CheD [Limnobacter sp.]|nr:chemoreceptor glutamine deamidase CheD [Limnobacter sp.]